MLSGRFFGSGIFLLWGLCVVSTFQLLQKRIVLEKSVMISAIGHHINGQGVPLSIRQREMKDISWMMLALATDDCPHIVRRL